MSSASGILDTNVVILLARVPAAQLPEQPSISTVTLAELAVGPLATDDPVEAARRLEHLRFAEQSFDPIPFDAAAARAFGSVAAALRRRDRKATARTFDAMIAAVALANRLDLYTVNASDFVGIDGLTVHAVEVAAQT